ncbi:DUF397 domain-containing protein [Kibdelosporangium aridum]|uniref:DUF397 domain-containing protein n=1 Tax=Kibdelosporangium aridum TaxID=2030 RepID=A0A428YUP1_KIBAR|nr:DUF397 domain-containing protein [Kibdelosporangium aridum]RSM73426.1 DUF397 domain-containing protein [Kibdelosporangium aridum]
MGQPEVWKKASFSGGQNGDCVEVRGDLAAVRDSKNPSARLSFSEKAMTVFIASLRDQR